MTICWRKRRWVCPGPSCPNGEPKTLGEIGKVYGVTRERIRQIEAQTLTVLKETWRAEYLRDYLAVFDA